MSTYFDLPVVDSHVPSCSHQSRFIASRPLRQWITLVEYLLLHHKKLTIPTAIPGHDESKTNQSQNQLQEAVSAKRGRGALRDEDREHCRQERTGAMRGECLIDQSFLHKSVESRHLQFACILVV